MARNRILYGLFVLACLIFSAAYQSRISAVLLVMAAAYPVLALILTAISAFTVRAGFGSDRAVYEKNEQFELPLYIRNNFIFPFAPVELDCMLPDNDTGLFMQKKIYVSVNPLKRMRIFIPCMHRYKGMYTVQINSATVYDPLKLIRMTRKLRKERDSGTTDRSALTLVILPRKILLPQLGAVLSRAAAVEPLYSSEVPHIPFSVSEREELSHIREYAEGDPLQMIHWKLTAKQQELMVKQYESDNDSRCVILCNFGGGDVSPSAALRMADAVTEAAVAAAMTAAYMQIRTSAVLCGSSSDMELDISDRGGFDRFYDLMSVLPPEAASAAAFPALIKRYAAVGSALLLLITPLLTEEILAAAELAARRSSARTVVLLYVGDAPLGGTSDNTAAGGVRLSGGSFVFAHVSGDSEDALSEAADSIVAQLGE